MKEQVHETLELPSDFSVTLSWCLQQFVKMEAHSKYNVLFCAKMFLPKLICKVWKQACILIVPFPTLFLCTTDMLLRIYNGTAAFVEWKWKKKNLCFENYHIHMKEWLTFWSVQS